MTIQEAINGYDNGKLIIDKLVCQFVSEAGSRVIYRFVVDSDGLYLRRDEIIGFGEMETSDIELSDDDVQESFPQYIADFLQGGERVYDIYRRDTAVEASDLLTVEFLEAQDLEGAVFMTY